MAIEDLREIGNVLYERRADGMLYPVRRMRPDTEARGVPPQDPSLLNVGGIGERLAFLNQTFNPVEGIGGAMRAGERLFSQDADYLQRIEALGSMLSGVAGIAAPIAAARAIGVPAASAMMEGLLGFSPTTQAAGDTMRAAGRDIVDRLNQPGPVPVMYSNPIPGVGRGEAIDDVLRARYPDVKISVSGDASKGYTLNRIDVPKSQRNSGIGTQIMQDLVDAVDAQGATLKLSPSGDFGGSVPRLKEFYKRFGFVENKGKAKDFGISESMYRLPQSSPAPTLPTPRNEAEAMARDILQLRAEGRADEVTEQMMDAADDQYMYFNTPLPMDTASRMARAEAMGKTADAYHATSNDFSYFIPSEFRGASFFGPTPEGAQRGASASANEGLGSGSNSTIPVKIDTSRVEGIGSYSRADENAFRSKLEDRIYSEEEVDALMASDEAPLRGNWSYFFDDLTDYEALRKFRDENPDAPIPEGIIASRPKKQLSYGPSLSSVNARDISGRQFAHYSEGMSERPISEYVQSQGNTGFSMLDESGLALGITDPTTVRSRFARFDPAFANLRNLSAGVGGAAVLTALGDDAEAGTPETQIIGLVNQAGIAGAAEALGVSRRDIEEAISIVLPPSQWDQLVVGPQ
jgi:GNAT superfamily N-acetyltransferase